MKTIILCPTHIYGMLKMGKESLRLCMPASEKVHLIGEEP